MGLETNCLGTSMLETLVAKRATIANFSEIYESLEPKHKNLILKTTRGERERTKWMNGKANLPLRFLQKLFISKKLPMHILREARFSMKGVGTHKIKLPLEINEDLSYFLGILAGDGYISSPKPHQTRWWIIQMCEDDQEFQSMVYIPLVERLFCYSPKIRINKRTDGRRNAYTRINSYVISLYLTKVLGIKSGYKTDSVEIPVRILQSEEKIRLAFVRGLFDTDGTVTGGTARHSTVSENLFYQIQEVLRSKGQLGNFSKIIGFKNHRKKTKLDDLLAPSSSGQG
jgi:intein/homing endonuclease